MFRNSECELREEVESMAQTHVRYDPAEDAFVGAASVDTPIGPMPVLAVVHLKPLGKAAAKALIHREMKRAGLDGRDQVGFFGFIKKAWKKVWNRAKTIARAVGVTKVLNAVKKGAAKAIK